MAQLLYFFVGDPASFGVCCKHLTYRFQFPSFRFSKHHLNYGRNLDETDTTVKKWGHCHLVRGVQGYSFCTSRLRRFIGQTETREFSHVRWRELQMS